MEKSDQNGDIEGDTTQTVQVAGDDLTEKVNGELIRGKKAGDLVEEDSVGTGQESEEEFSQQEISRTSDYEEEEEEVLDRVNGRDLEEEEDTEEFASERQVVTEVSESTQDVELVEELEVLEVTERQETLDEVTQGSEDEVEISGRDSTDLGFEQRDDQDYSEIANTQELATEEEESVAEIVEEKQNSEPVEVEEEEEELEEPSQEEDLVDCKPETKEFIQSPKAPAKEHKTKDDAQKDSGKLSEGLFRRRSSAENFQKLKDRFGDGTKVEENNRKNIEDEKTLGGAKNMSDKSKRFGGTSEKCTQCNRTVYPMEKMEVAGRLLHKTCFKCCKCNSQLSVGRFSIGGKDMYCMTHYKQAFREKGNYDVFTPDNPIKGKWENK